MLTDKQAAELAGLLLFLAFVVALYLIGGP
jgi:hypothetical protein